jgi:GT2 family glycosyltransferase
VSALAVVPTYLREPRDLELVITCLETMRKTETEIAGLVVDDGSPAAELVEEVGAACERLGFELHVKPKNSGFARTVNVGLQRALDAGQDAVLVNADVEFPESGWLEKMQAQPRSDGEGLASVVGGLLLYPSGLIQHAGIFFSLLTREFDHIYRYAPSNLWEAQLARVCPVTGALQFIRHECLASVGIYDPAFRMGWEDVDYCIRVWQQERQCVYQPLVRAIHHESVFRGRPNPKIQDWQTKSWAYWKIKWGHVNFAEFIPSLQAAA